MPGAPPRRGTARPSGVAGRQSVDHAFLLDTKTRGDQQRRGIATRVVALAAQHARAAGCEWLHVDFRPEHRSFYVDACGFQPTDAGLIHLPSLDR